MHQAFSNYTIKELADVTFAIFGRCLTSVKAACTKEKA